ncbi:SPOR domain-containing protein [Solilutibacter silvestris]|uniref:Sporulation related domain-containing protein n=1 Tax=Solilutibacter silvestris TaxID=1645665 RepID=A0A2K1Q3H0_9GAMM|nr:SPOR domain-containing protein [Lysobacter silvestris]PNS09600.1 Sporulation related domain-containing protein [Lysobacter silvestris]
MDRPVKQRLWGAAVLIALAVIFLPMLVKGPAPDSGVSDVPLDSPKAPDATVKTQELPLDVPGAVGKAGATGMPAAQADPAIQATAAAANAPVAAATPAANYSKPSPAMAAGDYAVNFGSYGSSADADRVVQALTGIQLHGYSEKVSVGGRDAWRVRVGPFPTREAAEIARVRAGQLNAPVKAQVIALDAGAATTPVPAAPVSTSPAAAASHPVADGKPIESQPRVPTSAETKPKATTQPKPEKAVAAKPTKPQPTEPATEDAAQPAAAKQDQPTHDQPKPEPKPADKPAASGTGFAVQLGAFANAADATALRDKARAAGFSATTDTVNTDKGVLTRVRLGPVVGRDAAESLKARAQAKLGVGGIIRPSP